MNGPDRDFDAALDRFSVPAPRAGLIDDIVAAAQTRAEPGSQPWDRAPRDRRGGWLRGHRVIAATMAATVLSATAAAAAGGWLGEAGSRLPVLAQIASVMPESVKAPSVRIAQQEKRALAAASAPTAASLAPTQPLAVPPRQQKVVDRIETRLERREARRAEMGLPAGTEKERALLDRFKTAETRAERREVIQEAKALRQERRAERQALPVCAPDQARNAAANGCRPKMTPEKRAEIMERLCARMAENGRTPPRCRPIVSGGPEPLRDPTPQ